MERATTPLRRALLTFVLAAASASAVARAEEVHRPSAGAAASTGRFAAHVAALKQRLPPRFSVAVAPPFVVIGDEPAAVVRSWATGTVSWAVARLKALLFARDPDEVLEVWLFKDEPSYRAHTRALLGREPTTRFGYYLPARRALVLNIATGAGTLVHEIVHPYVHANFPGAPPWLNEGLGALYERPTERHGRIWGLPNFRLPNLQRAIRAGTLPDLERLTGAGRRAFYDGRTSYGHARYLLYYLQEHGLLVDFYRRFHAARREDPTGRRTLAAVLGTADLAAFQRRWEAWVLALSAGDEGPALASSGTPARGGRPPVSPAAPPPPVVVGLVDLVDLVDRPGRRRAGRRGRPPRRRRPGGAVRAGAAGSARASATGSGS